MQERRGICRHTAVAGLLVAGALTWASPAGGAEPRARVVTYDELSQVVRGHRGKVVVVDFWALFCVPCMRDFPHLVDLHNKYSGREVVVLSVCLLAESPPDEAVKAKVEKFLRDKGAAMPSYILAEPPDVWTKRLGIDGPPCIYIFNRANFFVEKLADEVDHKAVEAAVKKLLGE